MSHHMNVCQYGQIHGQCRCIRLNKEKIEIACPTPERCSARSGTDPYEPKHSTRLRTASEQHTQENEDQHDDQDHPEPVRHDNQLPSPESLPSDAGTPNTGPTKWGWEEIVSRELYEDEAARDALLQQVTKRCKDIAMDRDRVVLVGEPTISTRQFMLVGEGDDAMMVDEYLAPMYVKEWKPVGVSMLFFWPETESIR